ncbi:MAG: tRNA 2-thiouridine(34) synthase MnmA [Patescibacteria group bacterium]|jgi:tRNA-specific 2-thiouridylase
MTKQKTIRSGSAKPTVFVAMSGGVDSSVAAALLQQQGFNVVGVFMKNWSDASDVGGGLTYCTAEQDFLDMRAVCQHLDIPYYTFNFETEYKKRVLDYFFAEYKAGRTPNPDVMCNKEVKFDLFLKKCLALGADFIATGHYAQRVASRESRVMSDNPIVIPASEPESRQKNPSLASRDSSLATHHLLLKGADPIKDQTYFLYNLTQDQLAKTLFPVGQYPKSQVRALARKFKLPTATKKDSQGICFIGPVDVKEFLKTVIKTKTGKIVNQEGKMLGTHEGAWFYTIGQRRVEGLAGQPEPLYVIDTDIKKNLVIVGPDSATYGKGVILENLHWVEPSYQNCHPRPDRGSRQKKKIDSRLRGNDGEENGNDAWDLQAKPRYGPEVYGGKLVLEQVASNGSRGTSSKAVVIPAPPARLWGEPESRQKKSPRLPSLVSHDSYSFIFDHPQRALTRGQSLVIYDEDICLGGGVIEKVIK